MEKRRVPVTSAFLGHLGGGMAAAEVNSCIMIVMKESNIFPFFRQETRGFNGHAMRELRRMDAEEEQSEVIGHRSTPALLYSNKPDSNESVHHSALQVIGTNQIAVTSVFLF